MGRGIKAGKKKKLDKKIREVVDAHSEFEKRRLVEEIKDDVTREMTDLIMYQHNIDVLAMMFALRDEFGFGKERLIRTLKRASSHSDNMFVNKMNVDEMLDILETETGIKEDDLVFTHEIEVMEDVL